ncbi:MAG TPA: aminopeptidase P N-terminal domain-containing protein, partial [Zeimonas sp.]|nr:aminopeptidase P N-terminal domain-containing protein [Zeimonas sp.]
MLPYSTRRQRLADTMRAHGGGIAIAFTAPEVARNRDSEYPYRWDSYFHYLTGFPEPEAALVLVVDGATTESILFCREKNEEREIWDGFRFGPDAARERFGFDRALAFGSLDEELPKLLADRPALWYAL